jgi:hypothetical protein
VSRDYTAYDARCAARAKSAFAEIIQIPILVAVREGEIGALPRVDWKGRQLRTLRCAAGHDYNATEALCWSLISLRYFACPGHPGALWSEEE